jgi:zinc transporter
MGETVLLILRGINHNTDHRPEEMVALRIFITPDLIISSRRRPLLSEQDVFNQLTQGGGADTPADWLVEVCDALTDRAGEFVEDLHDQILELEEHVLARDLPANGRLARIRKQLIMIRRYLSPQRDLVARLANEKISWLDEDDRRRLLDIADRLRRWLDDLDAGGTVLPVEAEVVVVGLELVFLGMAVTRTIGDACDQPVSLLEAACGFEHGRCVVQRNHRGGGRAAGRGRAA